MKKNIIYVCSSYSSFVKKDITFLKEKYELKVDIHSWKRKYLLPLFWIKQCINLLFKSNKETVYVIMFAGHWSVIPIFLANLFNRPSYLILGGTDCVSFPEFNYGSLRKKFLKKSIAYSLKKCTKIIPVANELIQSDYTYFDAINKKQGYLSFFPEIKTPVEVIFNGYNAPIPPSIIKKQTNSFITIAVISDETRFELKGLDLVIALAERFPNCSFTIIGISSTLVKTLNLDRIENITCHPFANKENIETFLWESQFYLSLSLSEGFPNALCEAMSCECIPIGSNVSSIPYIIGDTGYILNKKDHTLLFDLISKIVNLPPENLKEKGKESRKRINEKFPLQKRKNQFSALID